MAENSRKRSCSGVILQPTAHPSKNGSGKRVSPISHAPVQTTPEPFSPGGSSSLPINRLDSIASRISTDAPCPHKT